MAKSCFCVVEMGTCFRIIKCTGSKVEFCGNFGPPKSQSVDDADSSNDPSSAAPTLHPGTDGEDERFEIGTLKDEAVLFATSSTASLAVSLPNQKLKHARSPEAFQYVLEEWLPLSAEDMVAGRIVSSDSSLAIAVDKSRLGSGIDSIESCGSVVQNVCPTALLALSHLLRTNKIGQQESLVAWSHDDRIEVFKVAAGKPTHWLHVANSEEALLRGIGYLVPPTDEEQNAVEVFAVQLSGSVLSSVDTVSHLQMNNIQELDYEKSAAREAAKVLAGNATPLVELRTGSLASKDRYRPIRHWINAALVLAVILLSAINAGLLWRSREYRTLASNASAAQEKVYRKAYPEGRIPSGIRSRLESELKKSAGQRGHSGQVPSLSSSYSTLRASLESLPANMRFRIFELRIEQHSLNITGEVRSHGDADRIVAELKKRGFNVSRPRTDRIDNRRVSFSINADRQTEPVQPAEPKTVATDA